MIPRCESHAKVGMNSEKRIFGDIRKKRGQDNRNKEICKIRIFPYME